MKKCLLCIFIMFFACNAFAINVEDRNKGIGDEKRRVNIGLGGGASRIGLAVGISHVYQDQDLILIVRYIGIQKIDLFRQGVTYNDISLLWSMLHYSNDYIFTSISAGLGIFYGERNGKYLGSTKNNSGSFFKPNEENEKIPFMNIGIPLEAQLSITPFSSIGISVNAFANLNTEKTVSGLLLCIQIGKLR
jgi:hypothetical protein